MKVKRQRLEGVWALLVISLLIVQPANADSDPLQGLRGGNNNDVGAVTNIDARQLDYPATCVYCEALAPTGITDSLAAMVSDALETLEKCENEGCVEDMVNFVDTIRKNEEKYKRITKDQSDLLRDFMGEVEDEVENELKEEKKAKQQAEKIKHGFKQPPPTKRPPPPPPPPPCRYCPILRQAEFSKKEIKHLSVMLQGLEDCQTRACAQKIVKGMDRTRRHWEEKNMIDQYQSSMCRDVIKKALDDKLASLGVSDTDQGRAGDQGGDEGDQGNQGGGDQDDQGEDGNQGDQGDQGGKKKKKKPKKKNP